MTLYFAYGANISKDAMRYRCPDAISIGPFILKDWELKFYNHATIEPKFGASVPGVLWRLTEMCETTLDIFEGFPIYYKKRLWDQDDYEFFFYEMNDPCHGEPNPYYVNGIREGYEDWNLPTKYLDRSLLCHS